MKSLVACMLFVALSFASAHAVVVDGKLLRPVTTYSIVARDPETGQLGVAVQSHWFSVGPGLFTKHVVRHLIQADSAASGREVVLLQTDYQQHAFTPRFAYKHTDRNWLNAQFGPGSVRSSP